MISLIRNLCLFVMFTFFLSITIDKKTLFTYVYQVISPITIAAQNSTQSVLSNTLEGAKGFSKKLFDNSLPRFKDSVKSKMSSMQKKEAHSSSERITDDEREELKNLIKNH